MFWNIDVKEQEQDLMAISRFLLSVFEFAADQPGNVFQREDWLAFSPKNGKFSLESDQLSDAAQKILKDFFGYFYDVVLCTTHFHLNDLSSPMYSIKELVKDYFKGKNKKIRRICPVCLNTISNGETDEDVEHYFPRSKYPCLCLHPYNLYFCCSACNSRFKGVKSPLKGKQRNIGTIFLPYLDTVKEQVQLEFENPKDKDSEVVKMLPAEETDLNATEKIKEFDRLFSLEERWSGQLEECYMSLYLWYQEKIKERSGEMSLEQLKKDLEADIKQNQVMQTVQPGKYLEGEYMKWILEKQLKAFYEELKN